MRVEVLDAGCLSISSRQSCCVRSLEESSRADEGVEEVEGDLETAEDVDVVSSWEGFG